MFRSIDNPEFLIPPLLLDAAGQVLGFWAADRLERAAIVFPFAFEHLSVYSVATSNLDHAVCQVEVKSVSDTVIKADLHVVDASGRTLMGILGWEAKRFDLPENYYAFRLAPSHAFASLPTKKALHGLPNPERFECRRAEFRPGFLEADGGIWRECLAHLMLSAQERERWRTLGQSEARRTDWLLGRLAAKDAVRFLLKKRFGVSVYPADIEVDGEPGSAPIVHIKSALHIRTAPIVSIAHADGTAVAIATEEGECLGVGIDLEHDENKDAGLEALGFTEEEKDLLPESDPGVKDHWLMRLWCAKEAAAKALGMGLLGGPGTWLARDLDPDTGIVKLRPSDSFTNRFPQFREACLLACTEQESNLIFATAIREGNSYGCERHQRAS